MFPLGIRIEPAPIRWTEAVRRGREMLATEIREAAEGLRAKESATLDALHEAWLPAALDGDPRAEEIVLKVRRDYRELNDLDLRREPDGGSGITVINTALPPEALVSPEALAGEMVDEESAGELQAGAG